LNIVSASAPMANTASDGMGNTVITYDANDTITLLGVSPSSLQPVNFRFA